MEKPLMDKLVYEARHYRNKDFLEAVMAVCALIALADDEFQAVERQRIFQAFARVPALRELDFHQALNILKAHVEALGRDGPAAKDMLYNKVGRMAGRHKRVRTLMRLAYLIILADDEVHEGELEEVRHICRLLGLEPDQVWQELIA